MRECISVSSFNFNQTYSWSFFTMSFWWTYFKLSVKFSNKILKVKKGKKSKIWGLTKVKHAIGRMKLKTTVLMSVWKSPEVFIGVFFFLNWCAMISSANIIALYDSFSSILQRNHWTHHKILKFIEPLYWFFIPLLKNFWTVYELAVVLYQWWRV